MPIEQPPDLVFAQLIMAWNEGRLSDLFFHNDQRPKGIGDHELGSAIAELHNSGEINVLSLSRPEALAKHSGHHFFIGQNLFLKVIPKLNASLDEVAACVAALVNQGGADLAATLPNGAFREWCEADPERGDEVIWRALRGDEAIEPFLVFGLQAVRDLGRTLNCIESETKAVQMSGITASARLAAPTSEERDAIYGAYAGVLERGADPDVIANILSALFVLASEGKDFTCARVIDIARICLSEATEGVCHVAAQALCHSRVPTECDLWVDLFRVLLATKPENKGTVIELDVGLRNLLEGERAEHAIDFVAQLVSGSDGKVSLEDLSSFSHALLENDHELHGYAVGSWLVYGEPAICDSLGRVAGLHEKATIIPISRFSLTEVQKVKLCKRAIGFLMLHPVLAASVLVSVARDCEPDTGMQIAGLLYNPILVNYSGRVREYLVGVGPEDAAHKVVTAALDALEKFIVGLENVGELRELQPSTNERFIGSMREFDEAKKVHQDAHRQSVFANLVRRSTVLYGDKTISHVIGSDGQKRRFEMELHSHSVSFEMPRMLTFAPVQFDYMLRLFRTERVVE